MKSTLKLATAAVALALSGAALAIGPSSATGAAGDLFVDVYDPASGDTFAFDLGVAVSSTAPAYASVNLSSYSNWSSFVTDVTAAGGSVSNLDYVVLGGSGTTRSGSVEFGLTAPGAVSYSAALADASQTIVSDAGATGYVSAGVIGIGSGTGTAGAASNWASLVAGNGNTFGGTLTVSAEGTTSGGPLSLYYFTPSATSATTAVTSVSFNGTSISIGTAAVPEPGTYALMAAGLLAVGAIVRRRSRG